MTDVNSAMLAFLSDFYSATLPASPDLTQLIQRYLDDNPDGIADRTGRFQQLIRDALAFVA